MYEYMEHAAETDIYKGGTYTGTGKCSHGNTKVTVTVKKSVVSDITIDT
jgi:uncharacterized protein with FMN-binding domain